MRRGVLVVVFVGLLALAGCVDGIADGEPDLDVGGDPDGVTDGQTGVDGELEIHHIDVGGADATLLVAPSGETMLIDTGDWRQDDEGVLEYLEARDIDRIDHLVATHGHADHIGGHAAVIEHYETEGEGIGAAYDSGVAHTTRTYGNYLDAVENHDVELFVVEEGDALPFGDDVSVTVLNPPAGDSGTDLHENSVTLAVEFGEFRYLTTGDAESRTESRLVDVRGVELDADVYQAGHHGSSTSSNSQFLDAVAPEMAVISSDVESQYGHPHDETLERFATHGIETYWTGVHGDIVVTTDGNGVSVAVETAATTDPLALLDAKSTENSRSVPAGVSSARLRGLHR